MFSGHTHNLPTLDTFAKAHTFFNKHPKPRSSRWEEHQRPLRDARQSHYRIERKIIDNKQAYDLCLYDTIMGRLFEPDSEGYERRMYRNYETVTSGKFLWDVLFVGNRTMLTTDGRRVTFTVPTIPMANSSFSVDSVFTQDGRLVVKESRHTPLFKRASSADDMAMRAHIKRNFENLFMLIGMRLHTYRAEFLSANETRYMLSSLSLGYDTRRSMRTLIDNMRDDEPPTEQGIDALFGLASGLFSVQLHAALRRVNGRGTYAIRPSDYTIDELIEVLPEKKFLQALWQYIVKEFNLNKQTGVKPYPQFPTPEELTLSNMFATNNPPQTF